MKTIFVLVLLYIIPLALCILFEYLCMRKGESVAEYMCRVDLGNIEITMILTPLLNIIYMLVIILSFIFYILFDTNKYIDTLWHKIKAFRK